MENAKLENSHVTLEKPTLGFSSYKALELKIKLCWAVASERKKGAFFLMIIVYVLSQCIRNWISF